MRPTYPNILVIALLAVLSSSPAFAQHGSKLTTPEWNEFRAVALRYDSLQAAFKRMQEEQPELKRNPILMQTKLQSSMQQISAIYQAVPAKARPALKGMRPMPEYGLEDLRLIKLAAISTSDVPTAIAANDRLATLLKDADSVRQVKRELAQLAVVVGDLDRAMSIASSDALRDAPEMEKAQIFLTIASAAAADERLEQSRDYALRSVRALLTFRSESADGNGTSADSAQRLEFKASQDNYFASQIAEATGPVAHLIKRSSGVPDRDAFIEQIRLLVKDDAFWKLANAGIGESMRKLDEERKAVDHPATAWAPHRWIGSEPLSLDGLKGKVVLVDFFATWCKPCIMAFPHLQAWKEKYAAQGLVVLGLTTFQGRYEGKQLGPEEEFAKVRDDFIPKHKVSWPVGIEKDGRTTFTDYGVNGIPHVVLIDKKGTLRYFKVGAADYDKTENMIKKLLAEK
jgi:thiol-disulfide isomerase/thioredoxin